MSGRANPHKQAQTFFEDLWKQPDHWEFDSSPFEHARTRHLIDAVGSRRYGSALELGCGSGVFTQELARIADHIVAVDISDTAIERARQRGLDPRQVDFRVANIMELDPHRDGPWDLIVLNETIYYLGWLYSFYEIAWLSSQLFAATRPGGVLLLSNTDSGVEDELLRPWIIRTYRDLFRNVGYEVRDEWTFRGIKNDVELGVLTTLLEKPLARDVA